MIRNTVGLGSFSADVSSSSDIGPDALTIVSSIENARKAMDSVASDLVGCGIVVFPEGSLDQNLESMK